MFASICVGLVRRKTGCPGGELVLALFQFQIGQSNLRAAPEQRGRNGSRRVSALPANYPHPRKTISPSICQGFTLGESKASPIKACSENITPDARRRLLELEAHFPGVVDCLGHSVFWGFRRKKARLFERACLWLRGQDLNLRPSGYEPDELPGCSTPRGWGVLWGGSGDLAATDFSAS